MDFWKTKKFKELHQEWNERLKELGHTDKLEPIAPTRYKKASWLEREARLEYYLRVEERVNRTIFPNAVDAIVMQMHSNGATIREIVEEIQRQGLTRDRRTIRFIIRRYQTKWEIRSWSQKQMNSRKIGTK